MGEKPTEADEEATERRGPDVFIKREQGGAGQPVTETVPTKGEGGGGAAGIAVSDPGAPGDKSTK